MNLKTASNREKRLNGRQSNFVGGEGNREAFVRSLPLIPPPDVDLEVPSPHLFMRTVCCEFVLIALHPGLD